MVIIRRAGSCTCAAGSRACSCRISTFYSIGTRRFDTAGVGCIAVIIITGVCRPAAGGRRFRAAGQIISYVFLRNRTACTLSGCSRITAVVSVILGAGTAETAGAGLSAGGAGCIAAAVIISYIALPGCTAGTLS